MGVSFHDKYLEFLGFKNANKDEIKLFIYDLQKLNTVTDAIIPLANEDECRNIYDYLIGKVMK